MRGPPNRFAAGDPRSFTACHCCRQQPGNYSFTVLHLEQALVAQATGDLRTAVDLADRAMAVIEAAVRGGGQGAPFIPTALVRRAEIQLQAGRLDQSTADARHALTLLKATAQPGTFSSALGHAHLTLARGLHAQGQREEMRAELASALAHLESAVGSDHPQTRLARELAAVPPPGDTPQ